MVWCRALRQGLGVLSSRRTLFVRYVLLLIIATTPRRRVQASIQESSALCSLKRLLVNAAAARSLWRGCRYFFRKTTLPTFLPPGPFVDFFTKPPPIVSPSACLFSPGTRYYSKTLFTPEGEHRILQFFIPKMSVQFYCSFLFGFLTYCFAIHRSHASAAPPPLDQERPYYSRSLAEGCP